jgi:pyruvate kinase
MREDTYQLHRLAKDVPRQQRNARTASVTKVDFLSNLDINSRAANVRLSRLICTVGPASKSVDTLFDMIEAGMNVARLNVSHGTQAEHADLIRSVRQAAKMFERESGFDPCVAIVVDTKGPEIRTGYLEGRSPSILLTKKKQIVIRWVFFKSVGEIIIINCYG